jgi:hypothetical protein
MKVELISPLLTELGFKKRGGEVFTMDLAPGVLGWLGLNRATRHRAPGDVEINPVVGVRFQDVERIVAECRGVKFHAYEPPTISSPLGYVMPETSYKAWVFRTQASEKVALEMTHAIKTHGLPSMRSVVDLSELCRRFEEVPGFEHQLVYRRPVGVLLAGDAQRAHALLDETLVAIGSRNDAAAVDFKSFAAAFRSRLPSQTSTSTDTHSKANTTPS